MTEATQPVFILFPEDLAVEEDEKKAQRLTSAGRPALGVEIRIVDEREEKVPPGEAGEILIRGENVMKGYWKDPEATQEVLQDGWLHTGDVAKMDKDGYIYIVDRKKDMIISGGFNIYPREVERVIEGHPGVKEVAVIGVPDPAWGEAVKALIVPKPGAKITADEIIERCKAAIGSYKKPQSVEFVTELPKNFQGKILRTCSPRKILARGRKKSLGPRSKQIIKDIPAAKSNSYSMGPHRPFQVGRDDN